MIDSDTASGMFPILSVMSLLWGFAAFGFACYDNAERTVIEKPKLVWPWFMGASLLCMLPLVWVLLR